MTLIELSLKRQSIQLEENIILRQMQFRKYKQRLKEYIIKSKQKTIAKKRTLLSYNENKDAEAKPIITGLSKPKLEATLKQLKAVDDDEDEEEVIDLSDTPKNIETVNNIYNRKKAEINRVKEGFEKVMANCKERNLHVKVIAKLYEKQMQTITQISNKFSKL